MDWIGLAQNRDQWRAHLNVVMLGSSWVFVQLAASQEGLASMKSVSYMFPEIHPVQYYRHSDGTAVPEPLIPTEDILCVCGTRSEWHGSGREGWHSGNAQDVYSWGALFGSRSGHCPICLRFLWFSSDPPGKPRDSTATRQRSLSSKSSPIHHSPVNLGYDAV
jgi:hypothetical protein